jgi:hypothetical protein
VDASALRWLQLSSADALPEQRRIGAAPASPSIHFVLWTRQPDLARPQPEYKTLTPPTEAG